MHRQNNNTKNRRMRVFASLTTWMLVVAILLQSLSIAAFATADAGVFSFGSSSGLNNSISGGVGKFESDETIAQLKKDFLKSINKDLLMKVEDYKLTGEVGVILTFSDSSLVSSYSASTSSKDMTYEEYRSTSAADELKRALEDNHNAVLGRLVDGGLISEVGYNYFHILDGAYVTTTYEQLADICEVEGVERVIISDTYLPLNAVENPVNVHETGIFNSSDVSYTGKDTVVAILDTGCDYTHSAFRTHTVVSPHYDRDDIEALLPDTMAYSYNTDVPLEVREVYYGNITGGKIVYGYDYADKDADIMPFSSSHGTHVAGIIGGLDETIEGVAIDTQLAIMKVFSDYEEGADDGDILAALEDSIVLGVDAINMSLGASCGFSREVDDEYKNTLYDNIEKAGISLIVAASNDYSSGFGSEQGNTNKTDNPDSATVGSPSTYDAAMSVASINGNKDKYMLANGDREVFFHESVNQSAKEYNFFEMLGITKSNPIQEFEYVTIPGVGLTINYSGLDLNGKIALVKRGDISFEEKVQYAHEAGAVAIIIYNNVFGDISMTIGNDAKIPAVSIGKDDGEALAAFETGVIEFNFANEAGPFMSDFSSWGPNPDLSLKPEITAHGGNILSAIPGGGYEKLSGTSMAAPNMCGIVILIRQYVKENYPGTAAQVRDLVNQLCMSTATIALDRNGNPYSPRKQGAGIADIAKATSTPAYLYVDGIGKTKLELGDDPERTGVYTMTVNLKNLSDKTVSYVVGSIAMTESLSTSDPEYVAEIGYILSNSAEYSVTGAAFENGTVSVGAGETATVTVTLTLSDADKAYINESFENGMYVEGFLTFDSTDENGIDLNAPFLAFFGDWSEAPIFDLDYYEVETEAHNDAIDDDDKIKADYYATTPIGSYYYDYIIPLGSYVYEMDESEYTPIPATEDKAAVSYYSDCISGIYGVFTGLLRGAKEMNISIVDTSTGKVVWTDTQYNCYKAHYNGAPYPYLSEFDLPMVDNETGEVFGYNNTKYEVTMSAKLDWDGSRNSNDTYTFSFYIDYEAPSVTDATFRTEYDKIKKENRYYVDLMVYDNHYAMSLRPIIVYDTVDEDGEPAKTYSPLCEYPIPIYQENRGEVTKVSVEITDYLDLIKESSMPEGITFYIDDYALNSGVSYVPFPETENAELEFVAPDMDMDIGDTFDLATYLARSDNEPIESDYLKSLTWTTSDESVVAIHNGEIEALKAGSATVSVTGSTWTYTETVGGEQVEKPLYKTIVVNVSENISDNPNSSSNVQIESLEFTSYKTLFAFNNDIDYSEIGITDSTHYFGGNQKISFYPSEKVQLFYTLKPWNIDPSRYTLTWASNNPKVATVDENGVVTAESDGNARITLQISIDGKTSILAARCAIEVKSEFIIENRTLVAYKGKGGDVVIPDDEGIMTIGAFAFSHFDLDNEKEVEKDEEGNYDFDDKKSPLGNTTLTSVVIPDGVETINKYAFYNCEKLSNVTLPETCKTIDEYAFYSCPVLENVNFDNVQTVDDYAFYGCESLACDDIGGINLSKVSAIGDYAFAKTRVKSIDLSNLRRSGKNAFADCTKLLNVVLGERTRVSEGMFENCPITAAVIYSDTIADYAFKNCTKLTTVEFRTDLTYLGREAFYGCKKLSTVKFLGECEQIATFAFADCTDLESLTLPDCDVAFGDGVFASSGLETLVFDEMTYIESVGIGIFDGVRGMSFDVSASEHYSLVDGILYSKDGSVLVMALPDASLGSFTVPASVVTVAAGAFASNTTLTSVAFEDGSLLESIGYGAFSCCNLLRTVTLPENYVTIDAMAFYESPLRDINLEKVISIGDFAFENTSITEAKISADGVVVGFGAFYNCSALKNVTLGEAASVCEYAFYATPIIAVELLGGDVTVAEGAFSDCASLRTFDFTKLVGTVGNYAFYMCSSLSSVDMPYVTEIGEGSFADCYSLASFKADNLEVIGMNAFAPGSEYAQSGAIFRTVYMPKLREIGESAFYGCIYLEEIDLSTVTEMGISAFALCSSLERVTLSPDLEVLNDLMFYGCTSLEEINLDSIVTFGMGVLYGASIPSTLVLTNAEHIGMQAFIEMEEGNYLEKVIAPNLKTVGEQAFAGCTKLTSIEAPVLESIGYGAFAYTALEELEVSSALAEVEFSVFEGTETFKSFYAMVNGEKVYDFESDTVMVKDGVLYTVTDKGYVLTVYPAAKTDTEFTVADGTVRIEYTAALGNKHLEKLVFPESLRSIGNYAFYGCDSLKTVVFNSYYAPVLEGTVTGDEIKISSETLENYPGFDKLYRYDYYYKASDLVAMPLYYLNFVDVITSSKASNITYIIPDGCEGYDSVLYKAYFVPSEENSGVTVGKYAVAFIDAVNKLPETADRFDKKLVDAAINAYNALEGYPDELALVEEQLVEKFRRARSEYNVSVVENKIAHLFDMYSSEYFFELVKDARASFLALTADEQALVGNKDRLDAKIAELAEAMGKELNFNLTYAEHFPAENQAPDTTPPDTNDDPEPNNTWIVVLIVSASVIVAAAAATIVFILIKKKRAAK